MRHDVRFPTHAKTALGGRIGTVVVCSVTSNLTLGGAPGNVTLRKGEAGLPKRSVVNISQVFTVDKTDLVKRIGALSPKRAMEVLAGVRLLIEPMEPGDALPEAPP